MLCTFEIPYLYLPNKEPERLTILHTYDIQSGGLDKISKITTKFWKMLLCDVFNFDVSEDCRVTKMWPELI